MTSPSDRLAVAYAERKGVALARYELPFPPSVNNLFANATKGRYETAHYKRWQKDAGNLILAQGRKRVSGYVSLAIALVKPDKRRRDLSNTVKAIEDLLVDMAVIDDDSLVQRLDVRWAEEGPPCVVIVQEHVQEMAA